MADDVQQLLVAPNVVLERRNVEIADDHARRRPFALHALEIGRHLVQELKLVRILLVRFGIWNVAARGHIEIVHLNPIGQGH